MLKEAGWRSSVKNSLAKVIEKGAFKNNAAVFDFDDTLVCHDIGSATFEQLIYEGTISKISLPKHLNLSFKLDGKLVEVGSCVHLVDYYRKLACITKHQNDLFSHASSVAWLVQVMEGLTVSQVIQATTQAYNYHTSQQPIVDRYFKKPFFYPEMVELVGCMLDRGYQVWIVSASNVWSVRWMVTQVLNELLREKGFTNTVTPNHVIGISVLLRGPGHQYFKDRNLVQSNARYAAGNIDQLNSFKLSSHLVTPASEHYGKVANIMQWIGEIPYFAAGDSINDMPMLAYAQHRLWIAKLDYPRVQEVFIKTFDNIQRRSLIQPTIIADSSGFRSDSWTPNRNQPGNWSDLADSAAALKLTL